MSLPFVQTVVNIFESLFHLRRILRCKVYRRGLRNSLRLQYWLDYFVQFYEFLLPFLRQWLHFLVRIKEIFTVDICFHFILITGLSV
jgi:hypothetical protein